jgi:hypothetical protein
MDKGYKRDTLEMLLTGIHGVGPWSRGGKQSERLVTVTLVWPRPLVASRVAVQTHTFTSEGLVVDNMDWSERILFKENVEGPFGVIVQISQSMTAQQVARIAGVVGDAILRAAGSEVARIAVGPGLTALARFPFTFLAGEVAGLGKTAQVVAAGRATFLPGEAGVVEIPLQVPDDVVQVRRSTKAGRSQIRRDIVHQAGEIAGKVLLDLRYYRD